MTTLLNFTIALAGILVAAAIAPSAPAHQINCAKGSIEALFTSCTAR